MRYMRNALAPACAALSLIASAAGASTAPNTAATPPTQTNMAQHDAALQNLVQRNNARQAQRMAQAAPAPAAAPAPVLPPAEVEPPAPRTHQAAPAKAQPVPEADLSGLPVRADIRPPENAANHPGYIYSSDGVNCTLYPARCPR